MPTSHNPATTRRTGLVYTSPAASFMTGGAAFTPQRQAMPPAASMTAQRSAATQAPIRIQPQPTRSTPMVGQRYSGNAAPTAVAPGMPQAFVPRTETGRLFSSLPRRQATTPNAGAQPLMARPVTTQPMTMQAPARPAMPQPAVNTQIMPQPVTPQPMLAEPMPVRPVIPQRMTPQPAMAQYMNARPAGIQTYPIPPQPMNAQRSAQSPTPPSMATRPAIVLSPVDQSMAAQPAGLQACPITAGPEQFEYQDDACMEACCGRTMHCCDRDMCGQPEALYAYDMPDEEGTAQARRDMRGMSSDERTSCPFQAPSMEDAWT